MKRLVSGLKPTNCLTLGNYIGAIKQFIKMQEDYESYVFVADLHAITVFQDPIELRNSIRSMVALYIACGLDYNKTTIYIQSENLYHTNLSWLLECNSYMGELSRMTQYKDKKGKQNDNVITCGLFTYPVLMAADIIIYDADVVPVGEDQKQHVEITRDIANRFNNKYGTTFKIPEPVIPKQGARIKDLQDPTKKMSKSEAINKGSVLLLEDLGNIRKKIMAAVTDSDSVVAFDETNKPGISNLMTIYSVLTNKTINEVTEEFKGANYGTFKKAVADEVVNLLEPIQNKYNEIINSSLVDEILDKGIKKTNEMAKAKYDLARIKVGLGR